MKKSLLSKMHLKQHVYSHRMLEGTSLKDHLTVFKEIISNLENMELNIANEDLALILLCSLPLSYRNFVETLLYSHEKISLEEVFEALYSKEQVKQLVVNPKTHGNSLVIINVVDSMLSPSSAHSTLCMGNILESWRMRTT